MDFTINTPGYSFRNGQLLKSAKQALLDYPVNDHNLFALNDMRGALAEGFLALGDTDEAQRQARLLATMDKNASPGDWLRNGTKISGLAHAALIYSDAGNAHEAQPALTDARNIWDATIKASDPGHREWIYGQRLMAAYVAQGDLSSATEIYSWLDSNMEHSTGLEWSGHDQIVQSILSMAIDVPLGLLIRRGKSEEAFVLAQTLRDPDALLSALDTVLSVVPKPKECALAEKVATVVAKVIKDNGNDSWKLTRLADGASRCGLVAMTQNAIRTVMATNPDSDQYELAADAARIGDVDEAKRLLMRPASFAEGAEENCSNLSGYTPISALIGHILVYAALQDTGGATSVAGDALGQIRGLKDPTAKAACIALVAETLATAKIWDKAGDAALLAWKADQVAQPPPDKQADLSVRLVKILGQCGHFDEAKAALAGITDANSRNDARAILAVDAGQWGNKREVSDLLEAIGTNQVDYYSAAADVAKVYSGAMVDK